MDGIGFMRYTIALLAIHSLLLSESVLALDKEPAVLRTSEDIAHPADAKVLLSEITAYSNQIKKDPHNIEAYYYRGRVHLDMRDFGAAAADFRRSLEFNPYKQGMSLQLVNKDLKLKEGRELAAFCYQNLAYMYLLKGQYPTGIGLLSQAIALRPAYAINYKNRGLAYKKLGQSELAKKDFARMNQLVRHPEPDDMGGSSAAKDF